MLHVIFIFDPSSACGNIQFYEVEFFSNFILLSRDCSSLKWNICFFYQSSVRWVHWYRFWAPSNMRRFISLLFSWYQRENSFEVQSLPRCLVCINRKNASIQLAVEVIRDILYNTHACGWRPLRTYSQSFRAQDKWKILHENCETKANSLLFMCIACVGRWLEGDK